MKQQFLKLIFMFNEITEIKGGSGKNLTTSINQQTIPSLLCRNKELEINNYTNYRPINGRISINAHS